MENIYINLAISTQRVFTDKLSSLIEKYAQIEGKCLYLPIPIVKDSYPFQSVVYNMENNQMFILLKNKKLIGVASLPLVELGNIIDAIEDAGIDSTLEALKENAKDDEELEIAEEENDEEEKPNIIRLNSLEISQEKDE